MPRFYDVDYLPDGRIRRVAPNRPEAPFTVAKHTVMDLDEWQYPRQPLVPVAESVHERFSVEIFRGCTRGCRFCQAGMITRPVRERSITTIGEMVERGLAASGFDEVGLLSLSSADHSEINEIATGLADRYDGTNIGLSLPSTRVDAFNVTLADELSRNGRRSGLTFAPEGGSERMRKVINKMVTEDDLIRTVTTAYASGWRQVKLYFMCGLPTETDEDVLAIADLARQGDQGGPGGHWPPGHPLHRVDRRLRAQAAHAVPVGRPVRPRDGGCPAARALGGALRTGPGYGRAVGYRYHDGKPSIIEGLLSRGDRRVGAGDPGRLAGRRPVRRLERALLLRALAARQRRRRWPPSRSTSTGTPPASAATTRCCRGTTSTPGLDRDWLWQDWQDAVDPAGAGEVRGLPLDALLRLRGLPGHGHRDPDRADRGQRCSR